MIFLAGLILGVMTGMFVGGYGILWWASDSISNEDRITQLIHKLRDR